MAQLDSTLAVLAQRALYWGYHKDVSKIAGVDGRMVCADGVFGVWLQTYGIPYGDQAIPKAVSTEVGLLLREVRYPSYCVPLHIRYSIREGRRIPDTVSSESFEGWTIEREREEPEAETPSTQVVWPHQAQVYRVAKGIYLVLDLIAAQYKQSRLNHTERIQDEHRAVLVLFLRVLYLVAPRRRSTLSLDFEHPLPQALIQQVRADPSFLTKWKPALLHFLEVENEHGLAGATADFIANQRQHDPNLPSNLELKIKYLGSIIEVKRFLAPLLHEQLPAQLPAMHQMHQTYAGPSHSYSLSRIRPSSEFHPSKRNTSAGSV